MKHILSLNFPLTGEIMTTVRLATGGVGALFGLDLDAAEDAKVCITESLLLLTHKGFRAALVDFGRDAERLRVLIEGEDLGEGTVCPEDEISLALLGALVSDHSTEREEGTLRRISFSFGKSV